MPTTGRAEKHADKLWGLLPTIFPGTVDCGPQLSNGSGTGFNNCRYEGAKLAGVQDGENLGD